MNKKLSDKDLKDWNKFIKSKDKINPKDELSESSINKNNFEDFKNKFYLEFNEYPSHLSLLSYDLVGLVYYLSLKSDLTNLNNLFRKKNSFIGKIGIFEIKNDKIYHKLNFYKINDKKIIKIF